MSHDTRSEYNEQVEHCRNVFINKNKDYGPSWRIFRIPSLVDQIFIKAQRIRSIEEKQVQKVQDTKEAEFIGIANYCIIALIQMELGESFDTDADEKKLLALYDNKWVMARQLMEDKNHDYGEAWRQMYISSFTDMILSKILRIKQIIGNKGKTIASEGIEANFYDMINYAVFALIKLDGNVLT